MRRIALLSLLLLTATPALAGEHAVPTVTDPLTRKECGACHMAFQPAFLPARSWTRMMADLPRHFGEDASLPADKAAAIQAYLEANAGDRITNRTAAKFLGWVKPEGTPQRITENPYFIKEHRRISDAEWKKPQILTKSNCAACHRGAEQGWYDDD